MRSLLLWIRSRRRSAQTPPVDVLVDVDVDVLVVPVDVLARPVDVLIPTELLPAPDPM